MATNWREAKSLQTLLTEYNRCFPNRSKASDGMVGDAAHQSRDSDHNPWIKDPPGPNVVSAIDLTKSSAPGIADTAQWLVDRIVKRRDPRVKYLIHNHKIWRSYDKPGIPAWMPAPYTGANAHEHHAHISVLFDKKHYDSTASWGLETPMPKTRGKHIDAAIAELEQATRAPKRVAAALRLLKSIPYLKG